MRKVGLVAFDNNIDIIGDGSAEIQTLNDKSAEFNDFKFIVKNGVACSTT